LLICRILATLSLVALAGIGLSYDFSGFRIKQGPLERRAQWRSSGVCDVR
jgi:hypothetical protein